MPGATNNSLASYDFTVGRPINMDEAIYFISPLDAPLLTGFGGDGMPLISSQPVDQTTFYWMEEEGLLPSSTIATSTVADDATSFAVAAGHGKRFLVGDVIRVHKGTADEVMRVTGISTDTLTVTREYGGTTAVAYAAGDIVISIGTALIEGSVPGNSRQLGRTEISNYTEIIGPLKQSITRTEEGTSKYGIASEKAHQIMRRMQEVSIRREQGILYGVKSNDGAGLRSSGGLSHFLTQNVDSASAALSVAKIQANQLLCYNKGGLYDSLIVNPAALATLNDVDNTSRVRTENMDTMRGRKPVTLVATEYGDLVIQRHRLVNPKDGFGVTHGGLTRRVFDPVMMVPLAKIGDSEDVMIVGEEGLQVKGVAHMGRFTALT